MGRSLEEMTVEVERKARECFKGDFKQVMRNKEDPETKYWVDVVISLPEPTEYGPLDNFMSKVSKQLNIDKSFIRIWWFKEEELGVGFFLPYHRKLGPDEVRVKYIYVESEFQGYFPPPGEKFVVMGNKGQYEATIDKHGRIFLTEWFNDNISIKAGDLVSLWKIKPKRYIITLGTE